MNEFLSLVTLIDFSGPQEPPGLTMEGFVRSVIIQQCTLDKDILFAQIKAKQLSVCVIVSTVILFAIDYLLIKIRSGIYFF